MHPASVLFGIEKLLNWQSLIQAGLIDCDAESSKKLHAARLVGQAHAADLAARVKLLTETWRI